MDSTGARDSIEVREQALPQTGRPYKHLAVQPSPIPILREADVVVVGGGTSGAVAGAIAGGEGLRTVIVDMNPGLGGTGTYGGIHTYWFGRRTGFVEQVMRWVERTHDRLHLPKPKKAMTHWNPEAKSWALADRAEGAGVELLTNAYAIAALVEDRAVRGVVVATRWGRWP
jgi:flavin-dependent dehydrogenase